MLSHIPAADMSQLEGSHKTGISVGKTGVESDQTTMEEDETDNEPDALGDVQVAEEKTLRSQQSVGKVVRRTPRLSPTAHPPP